MREIVDLARYPLDDAASAAGRELIARCRRDLAAEGLFNLAGFLRPRALASCLADVEPVLAAAAFTHRRRHNIYFEPEMPGLGPGHPALREFETVNHTICADQIAGSLLCRLYEWPPLAAFLAAVMEMPELHTMADPLARLNVMSYLDGEALNWHFDRSEFTTTLLLQAPRSGGEFIYRRDLRSAETPNYAGVGRLLSGDDDEVTQLPLEPGTLNVFRGRNTAHRVSATEGPVPRIIAVFSYFDRPGVVFSPAERLGFYGRT